MHIRKSDVVQVISGDDRGKRGRVLRAFPKENRIVVEGVGYVYKHIRRSQKHPEGGRIQKEASISASNVMLVCSSCSKTTRPRHASVPEGTKVRVCSKCGEYIAYEKR